MQRAIELLQAEILVRRLGGEAAAEFDQDAWEKKLLKINNALRVMEKHKHAEPYFSSSMSELTNFLRENKSVGNRIASVGRDS